MSSSFPDNFRWGVATAAHQIEGANINSDWWAFEHREGSPAAESSGDACDSWNRWPEDVELIKQLGVDNYRFTSEWARIEPAEGEWSYAAIANYRRQCEALLEVGVDPIITLHHFTSPQWLSGDGSWANPAVVERFVGFVTFVAEQLGDVAKGFVTFNEPNIVSFLGYRIGLFPPEKATREDFHAARQHMIDAHLAAVPAIRAAAPGVPVGLTLSMTDYQAVDGGEAKRDEIRAQVEDPFIDATLGDDFMGVQTYSRERVGPDGDIGPEEGVEVLDMGYEYWPRSLGATVRRAWERNGGKTPLWVTENGIGTMDDNQRISYLTEALRGLKEAMGDGIDVRGYSCWSLLDNFEWIFGYGPHFGLTKVDRVTFERTPKESFGWFAGVVAANKVP